MFSLYNPLDSKNILENYPFKELKKGLFVNEDSALSLNSPPCANLQYCGFLHLNNNLNVVYNNKTIRKMH